MPFETKAIIDVGTNTIKLLVAKADCSRVEALLECKAVTNARLGTGFYKHQRLQSKTMHAAAEAIRELSVRASRYEPVSLRAIATSAVRDACNRDEFIALVRETTGLSLEVIPGKTEAEWIFRGATSEPSVRGERLLVIGFGGGSMAAIVHDSGRTRCRSFDLGAVRLMEMLHLGACPNANDRDRCEIYISQLFSEVIAPQINSLLPAKKADVTLVAAGGLATALASMKIRAQNLSWADEQSRWLSRNEISKMATRLWRLNPDERKVVPGLSAARCDVILPGIAILEGALKHLAFARTRVARRGVRYGALLDGDSVAARPFENPSHLQDSSLTASARPQNSSNNITALFPSRH